MTTPILAIVALTEIFGPLAQAEQRPLNRARPDGFVAPTERELKHPKGANKAVIGIVEKIIGVSIVQREGRGARADVSLGMRLFETDAVATDRSRLHIRFKDGTYLEMGEESAFSIERVRFKPANPLPPNKQGSYYDESVFRFGQGVVRVTAPDIHAYEHFTIKTTYAVFKITGPSDFYLIRMANDRDLSVRVARGKVAVYNAVTNEKMDVASGEGAFVKVSGLVVPTGPFTKDQLDFLVARTSI